MKRLNGWDAMLLYSETANVPTHTLKILVIDASDIRGVFTFELFRAWVQRRLPLLDPLRYKLVEVPFKLHHPLWLENCEVDLDYHLRRVRAPSPGGRREFDQVVSEIASGLLDRNRPLWELYFVEGMAHNRFAAVLKLHHALADGVASANLLARAIYPEHDDESRRGQDVTAAVPTTGELLRAAGRDHVHQIKDLPRVISDTTKGISRMRRRANERGVQQGLAPRLRAPKTFLNHPVSPGRSFATTTLSFADAKQTSKQLGATLNDLVLSVAAGALRELMLRYDGRADRPIVASVPTSLDVSPDRLSGNELSTMMMPLPVHVDDPLEGVRLTSMATANAKEDFRLLGPMVLQSWVEYLPPGLSPPWYRWRSQREARYKLFNLPISNVPGPRERGSIDGATVSEIYSVGPLLAGNAMNITVWSYVDQLNISMLTDDRTLNDPHELTDAMIRSLREIRVAAGLPEKMTEVVNVMRPANALS